MGLDMMFSIRKGGERVDAGYLRKANQIHNWIDLNVEGGARNCELIEIPRSDVNRLLDTINKVLDESVMVDAKICVGYTYKDGVQKPIMEDGQIVANPSVAQELLPTTSGFFFGSTDYDQFYIADLKRAKKIMQDFLADETNEVLIYQPWW